MQKLLVINGDDFGRSEGVNKAIITAHQRGVLTSATIMVNMPQALEAVKLAQSAPHLGVGVHINLTDGKPISQESIVGQLIDAQGYFKYSGFRMAILSAVNIGFRKAVRTEMAAQVGWFIDHGLKPTHLDSHKHIHVWPSIFSILGRITQDFGIPAVRLVLEPKQVVRRPWPLSGKIGRRRAAFYSKMAVINRLQMPKLIKTEAIFGISHFGMIDESFYRAVALYNPVQVAEVMAHPGLVERDADEQSTAIRRKVTEFDALCSERTKGFLRDGDVQLVHYGQLCG